MGSSISRRERRKLQRILGDKKSGNAAYELMQENGRKFHRLKMQEKKNLEVKELDSEIEEESLISKMKPESHSYSGLLNFLTNPNNKDL